MPKQDLDLHSLSTKIRRGIITSLYKAKSGHPGPSLSVADIVTQLFFDEMNFDIEDRDKFILSKGHAAPALYSAFAEKGLIAPELMQSLRELGSPLEGHPVKRKLPELIDASTGSLGQGLSMGIGYALAARLDNSPRRCYVVLGDGECQEGQVWEAAMAAAKFQLGNLVAILDYNKFQNDGSVEDIMATLVPLEDKWRAFGWHVLNANGHSFDELSDALHKARETKDKPVIIVADTVKGKGVSFMEGDMAWHSRAMNEDEFNKAMAELGGAT